MKESSIEEQIDTALHVDWAFKDVHGKPDKIIVSGYPKGAYHTGYEQFRSNMVALIQSERRKAAIEAKITELENIHGWWTHGDNDLEPKNLLHRIKDLKATLQDKKESD